eukprot:GHVN01085450.1.p2 GENE.GHVN01085450.1~~GHVN01085450.1.p2  ORF type:complete len:109 (+),score=38.35 GHVN01085450.1:572-898(+)
MGLTTFIISFLNGSVEGMKASSNSLTQTAPHSLNISLTHTSLAQTTPHSLTVAPQANSRSPGPHVRHARVSLLPSGNLRRHVTHLLISLTPSSQFFCSLPLSLGLIHF